ncbi:carbohydrate-binding family 9-like protein [Sphingobacterium paucimobilis]|uniref:Carbohydrate-binding domain-containing protein n=1 Tax=Sphingobacterium paucimobilis HER1398 TaxID=1346330 RepID=U2HQQ8_9SPHI|nr:carbohydrate-binding family 9-like protein [Sphingobacterium paucimobilis]ERJ57605.1 hypothetical protein M472_02375 [Sphingobacterium paucimobilis HER1398]
MNRLFVEKIADLNNDFEALEEAFERLSWNSIDQCPWQGMYPYHPEARFQIAHSEQFIYLHYKVNEEFVKGQYIRPNENVWEDSCVEFFVSFDQKQTYYNFEFNVLATGLIGYGPADKSLRNRLSKEAVESVDACTKVVKRNGVKVWEIFLQIPKQLFGNISYTGKTFHANFYKCGDGLPKPHFISWNTIHHDKPNFHLPEFFGEITFA